MAVTGAFRNLNSPVSHLGGTPGAPHGRPSAADSMYLPQLGLAHLYRDVPPGLATDLFQLEALIVRRLERLSEIDVRANCPTVTSRDELVKRIERHGEVEKEVEFMAKHLDDPNARYVADLDSTLVKHPLWFTDTEDTLAHFACRLAFCHTREWQDWFIRVEELLFMARTSKGLNNNATFLAVLEAAKIDVQPLASLDTLSDEARAFMISRAENRSTASRSARMGFFSVPLSVALRAVRARQCVLHRGRAIITGEQAAEVLYAAFRKTLRAGLTEAQKLRSSILELPDAEVKEQVAYLDATAHNLHDRLVVAAQTAPLPTADKMTPADIVKFAQVHFPPCMRRIDVHLRKEGHLKHHGRWMYTLFLRAAGLSMDDTVVLFGKLMSQKGGGEEKFAKSSYAYNIRHAHGKEGKRTEYSCMSCTSIIGMAPNVDRHDCHGCPFRFQNPETLRMTLADHSAAGVAAGCGKQPSAADIEDIVADARGFHYTRACFRYFTATRIPMPHRDTLFRSPAEYFGASLLHAEAQQEAASGKRAADDRPDRYEGDQSPGASRPLHFSTP